jgi:hypothetical protein
MVEPEFEQQYPKRFCARIEIEMKSGETRTGECRMEYGLASEDGPFSPPGTTTPPLDDEGMRGKFFDLACRRISREDAEGFLNQIFEFESIT